MIDWIGRIYTAILLFIELCDVRSKYSIRHVAAVIISIDGSSSSIPMCGVLNEKCTIYIKLMALDYKIR